MDRRQVLGGSIAAGVTGLAGSASARSASAPSAAAAAAAQSDSGDVANAIERLYRMLYEHLETSQPGPLDHVAQVRQQQRTFIRGNLKYPDYLDVGLDVWESVYFWHIHHRQPLQVARLPDGRYAITFMFTTLVLRPDVAPNYVSQGYDGGPTR
jgi:hypothetical protein